MQGTPRDTPRFGRFCLAIVAAMLTAPAALAAPGQYLTVGDPLEDELRLLDLFPRAALGERLRLPHLGSRPLQLFEIQGKAGPVVGAKPEVALSLARLERALGRDPSSSFAASPFDPSTPRVFQREAADAQRVEASFGLEGALLSRKEDAGSAVVSGSGLHGRFAIGFDRWLAYSHQVLGRFANAQRFADPVVANTDIIVLTEETYLSCTPGSGRWTVSFGRGRWHWGPGQEGSLILSRSAAPITALVLRGGLEAYRLNGMVMNATLRQSAGEHLAAHRFEWEPLDGLRIGGTEAVRYRAPGWQWLYAAGVLPYAVATRLVSQDEPDSITTLRSNLLAGIDVAWRIAPGTRVYGELAVDDLRTTRGNPNKIAWQLGWEGTGMFRGHRLSWGGEVTRVWRYVYTSFFGRAHEAQGRPLGFPTGPDSRRTRVRLAWDPSPDWQGMVRVTQMEQGENSLDEPYFPGALRPDPSTFEGVVERSREVELGLRWWPAGGIDLGVRAGWEKIDDRDHVPGVTTREWSAAVEVHLVR
ncbi:MAG: capsule assembly Wzi family protein [Candidatus Eiseniibacteriota bacterium]